LPAKRKEINILGKEVYAWIASSPAERERGLQYIIWLPKNTGMFFEFPAKGRYCFWNKNTWLKLKLVFMREGKIVEEAKLLPIWEGAMEACPDEPVDSVLEIVDN
jgi:uncharacterized membrane protein (UPF0127 family)